MPGSGAKISADDLPEVMLWLHQRCKLSTNVLVFSDELEAAAQLLIAADEAGVDAVIVQDVALSVGRGCAELVFMVRLRCRSPAAGIAQAAALGCQRVLARSWPFVILSVCSVTTQRTGMLLATVLRPVRRHFGRAHQ